MVALSVAVWQLTQPVDLRSASACDYPSKSGCTLCCDACSWPAAATGLAPDPAIATIKPSNPQRLAASNMSAHSVLLWLQFMFTLEPIRIEI
jgi:hypothetical protein